MNLDWTTIIASAIGLVSGGGITALFTIKQTKRSKELDNVSRILDEHKKLISEYKCLIESLKGEKDAVKLEYESYKRETDAKIDSLRKESEDYRIRQTEKVAAIESNLSIVQNQLSTTHLMYATANAMKCDHIACMRRTPKLDKDYLIKMMGFKEEDFVEEWVGDEKMG